ncbi:MAG: cytidylate kinase-like family protein, partial [Verrucomicrobia bacterium]|nr:cytidylate kinase-like family protein [Verrucomicrobiota bacterium]
MKTGPDLTKCLAFIGCQLNPAAREERHLARPGLHPAVTISRQTGSGAMDIARELSDFLQARNPVPGGGAVFDKNLVTRMLEDHNLPKQLAGFLPEDRISRIKDMMEEVFGLHPPSDTLIHQISETIVHLAELVHVVLVGRAAHVITRQAQNVFHVHLIAPMEKRQARVMARRQMDPEAALE